MAILTLALIIIIGIFYPPAGLIGGGIWLILWLAIHGIRQELEETDIRNIDRITKRK